ncbi:Tn3 family transposase, partial [Streptomyces sp. NPDC056452]|uniref:Tn3 family transposase n=1 Tax=Streptomyces sp. NPDC056452 TaxID=3345821 RepID=UPI0036AFE874
SSGCAARAPPSRRAPVPSAEAARVVAIQIANATFATRSTELWRQGSTAVASDSTHVRAYDQNLFTEWHSRYRGRGVLIYWHVEKKSLAIHSQLINCTASEIAAMLEVGRAQKTILVSRYLRLRDLQREIEEGLNVMESSNGANSVIAYGKGGKIASNRLDEQEMFVLCLRILQSALVYVNTLMLQDVLDEPEWADPHSR